MHCGDTNVLVKKSTNTTSTSASHIMWGFPRLKSLCGKNTAAFLPEPLTDIYYYRLWQTGSLSSFIHTAERKMPAQRNSYSVTRTPQFTIHASFQAPRWPPRCWIAWRTQSIRSGHEGKFPKSGAGTGSPRQQ